MSISRETFKNCDDLELENLKNTIFDLLDLPLSDDINEVIECLKWPDYCEHFETHEKFLKKSYKEIKEKIEDYLNLIRTAKLIFRLTPLFYLIKSIEFKMKTIRIAVKSYECNEWDLESVEIVDIVTMFENYLNSLFDMVSEELEKRKKQND